MDETKQAKASDYLEQFGRIGRLYWRLKAEGATPDAELLAQAVDAAAEVVRAFRPEFTRHASGFQLGEVEQGKFDRGLARVEAELGAEAAVAAEAVCHAMYVGYFCAAYLDHLEGMREWAEAFRRVQRPV